MSKPDFWAEILGERVLNMCTSRLDEPVDYEPQVRNWIKDIDAAARPTASAVTMCAVRKKYNLVPLK